MGHVLHFLSFLTLMLVPPIQEMHLLVNFQLSLFRHRLVLDYSHSTVLIILPLHCICFHSRLSSAHPNLSGLIRAAPQSSQKGHRWKPVHRMDRKAMFLFLLPLWFWSFCAAGCIKLHVQCRSPLTSLGQ